MGEKNKKELEIELELLKKYGIGTNITKILITLIQFGAIALVAYFASDAIKSLAGTETKANIDIKFWNDVLSSFFGGGGIYYGYNEKKLRKNTVERLQKRIRELESKLDKKRSSSGLTPLGNTNPEDL